MMTNISLNYFAVARWIEDMLTPFYLQAEYSRLLGNKLDIDQLILQPHFKQFPVCISTIMELN